MSSTTSGSILIFASCVLHRLPAFFSKFHESKPNIRWQLYYVTYQVVYNVRFTTAVKELKVNSNRPFDHLQQVERLPTQTGPYILTLPPPLKRRDSRLAGYTGGHANIQAVLFPAAWVYPRLFFKFHTWEKYYQEKKFIIGGWWDSNPRPKHPLSCRRRHFLRN